MPIGANRRQLHLGITLHINAAASEGWILAILVEGIGQENSRIGSRVRVGVAINVADLIIEVLLGYRLIAGAHSIEHGALLVVVVVRQRNGGLRVIEATLKVRRNGGVALFVGSGTLLVARAAELVPGIGADTADRISKDIAAAGAEIPGAVGKHRP